MKAQDVVVVPSTLAFLPAYAGAEDPIADLRREAQTAVAWLASRHPDKIAVLVAPPREDNVARGQGQPAGVRVAAHLLAECEFAGEVVEDAPALLVVANGTATRGERAPGHLDERAHAYDAALEEALRSGEPARLRSVDVALGEQLWAFDAPAFRAMASLDGRFRAEVDYAGDPFGVQYWVVRWTCVS